MEAALKTKTGLLLDYMNIAKNSISIYDIAHSLSLICRFNGHCKYFFSVAQHCLFTSWYANKLGYDYRIQMCALLHDAQEAYVCDLPTPLKKLLPEYAKIERRVQSAITECFDVSEVYKGSHKLIKSIDVEVGNIERKYLLEEHNIFYNNDYDMRIYLQEQSPVDIREKYINTFFLLKEELR